MRLFVSALFLCLYSALFAQYSVSIPDGRSPRGFVTEVPVNAMLKGQTGSISLKLTYNAFLFDIRSIRAGGSFIISEDVPQFNNNISNLEFAELTLSGTINPAISSDRLCILRIEGLAGPDSIGYIRPVELSINGNIVQDTSFKSGRFSIGDPVIRKFPESLRQNYPNPFLDKTTFEFTIDNETAVSFHIYSMNGRKIQAIPGEGDTFDYSVFRSNGLEISNPFDEKFERGKYSLVLNPKLWKISSGVYIIIMKTEFGSHDIPFMIQK